MSQAQHIVIIGAGQAGFQTAASLRSEGFAGQITLVGDEPGDPYQRPPLSKAYLQGKTDAAGLRFRPPDFYERQQIDRLHGRVLAIDRAARTLSVAHVSPDSSVDADTGTNSSQPLRYDHLVLAMGARNRVPSVTGIGLSGVFGLRSLADADALSPQLREGQRVVVVGAGFIGLEFAAVAAQRGLSVDMLEIAARPMARAISEPMSAAFDAAHRALGTRLHYGQALAEVLGDAQGRASGVRTSTGAQLDADLVVYGIGVQPNIELAQAAGLALDDGVRVDAQLQTTDPHISAVGDLVRFPSPWARTAVRLESVQNAADQARHLAARLTGKANGDYAAVPWFWSDQGEFKLQIAGLSEGVDHTHVLGDATQRQFAVLCFKGERLVAVETCNRAVDHMAARKLLLRGTTPTRAEAEAPDFELKAFEAATRPAT